MPRITDRVVVPEAELRFVFSRSSGPGGQHVNTTDTRVTLLFDLEGSPSLAPADKALIRARLGGRLDREGRLRISCQARRSQKANREAAVALFVSLLRQALRVARPRRPTRVPVSAKRQRLVRKKRIAERKRLRRRPAIEA